MQMLNESVNTQFTERQHLENRVTVEMTKGLIKNNGYTYWQDLVGSRYVVGIHSLPPVTLNYAILMMRQLVIQACPYNYNIGCWLNEDDGMVYIDRVVGFDRLEDAIECGKLHNQIAIYDTVDELSIPVKGFHHVDMKEIN
jgi:hypothetical protein